MSSSVSYEYWNPIHIESNISTNANKHTNANINTNIDMNISNSNSVPPDINAHILMNYSQYLYH